MATHSLPIHASEQRRRQTHAPKPAFTLVELALTVAIMTILMAGIASAILLASHALPKDDHPSTAITSAATIAHDIATELALATSVSERTPVSITFTVADRNADNSPETIRYAWTGTAGDPITRQYNAGTTSDVAAHAYEFRLDYILKTVTENLAAAEIEGPETLLASYDSTVKLADAAVASSNWVGQYFLPSLPVDATSWKVTRIKFLARQAGTADGVIQVQLRPPDAGNLPSSAVLEQQTISESTLATTYTWQEFPFSAVSRLSPTTGLCIVLEGVSGTGTFAQINFQNQAVFPPSDGFLEYTGSWSLFTDQALLFYVYGTVTTAGQPTTQTQYYLTGMRLALRLSLDTSTRVETGLQLLNAPPVAGP